MLLIYGMTFTVQFLLIHSVVKPLLSAWVTLYIRGPIRGESAPSMAPRRIVYGSHQYHSHP
jgi:hypothetical protein